jgi:hypothetical protein
MDGRHSGGYECEVEFMNQGSIIHAYLSYAKEVYLVNKINNVSRCKSKIAL